jgi:hypothetical protein
MTNPIRAALAAATAVDQAPTRHIAPEKHVAEIIAAFHRTLHDNGTTAIAEGNLPWLADYVLAAAKEERE